MGGRGQKWMCGLLSHGTLKSADELYWFFACWYKFEKAKNYLNSFWVVVIKNELVLLGHGTLKSAVPQELFDELGRSLAFWKKFTKPKSYFNI